MRRLVSFLAAASRSSGTIDKPGGAGVPTDTFSFTSSLNGAGAPRGATNTTATTSVMLMSVSVSP
jgi:hypothetical protein